MPPQNEDERFLMRRVEELCRTAMQRGIPRATGFLSDREQALAQAALNREGCDFARFQGGWPDAERKVLCIEPPDPGRKSQLRCCISQRRSRAAAPCRATVTI